MAGTPLVAVVACIACYRDQENISWFGWVVVDRSRRLKRLAQISGGAFLKLETELGGMAVSPNYKTVFCDVSENIWSLCVWKACAGVLSGL